MSSIVNKVPGASRDSNVSAAPDLNRLPRGESVGNALGELFTKTLFPAADKPTIPPLIDKTFLFLGTSSDDIVNADKRISALYWAAYMGKISVVRKLLDAGTNPMTILHTAVASGDVNMTKVLLDAGVNPMTLLHSAARRGDVDMTKVLLDAGTNPMTLLHAAARRGDVDMTEVLLAAGVNPMTLLHAAARRGDVDMTEVLLAAGANPNVQDCNQVTPLHIAAARGDVYMTEVLLAAKANPNAQDCMQWTPLQFAACMGNISVIRKLLDAGANPMTLLSAVAASGDVDMKKVLSVVRKLLDGGANPMTLLHAAAASGDVDMTEVLLAAGANPNVQDCNQETPLHFAAYKGNIGAARKLLAAGANPASKSHDFRTPGLSARIASPHNYELHKLLPLTDEVNRFCSSKYLSNTFNWSGLYSSPEYGENIKLERGLAVMFNPYLAESLRAFKEDDFFSNPNFSREKFDILLNAFDETNHYRTNEDIIESINSGKPCFIPGGWDRHAITLCFIKKDGKTYMAICNRGPRKQGRSTLEVFEIDPKMLNVELIEKMKKDYNPFEERDSFYYSQLPSLLHASKIPTQDELCIHIQKFAPKDQKSGKCAIASSTAAIRFAWMMLLYDSTKADETLQQGQTESKLFADFAAVHAWEEYKEETLPGLTEDPSFREAVRSKLTAIGPSVYQAGLFHIAERASRAAEALTSQ